MKRPPLTPGQRVTIEDLYPELTPEQQQEAAYFLKQYLAIIRRIYARMRSLTVSGKVATLQDKAGVSFPSLPDKHA